MFKKTLSVEMILKESKKENILQIQQLQLTKKRVVDILLILDLKNLVELELSECHLTDDIINPIRNMRGLQKLELRKNELQQIGYLSPLQKLTFLNLAQNNISDLRPLLTLYWLKELDLRCNKISDFQQIKLLNSISLYKLLLLYNSKDDNPIALDPNYRYRVIYSIPYLKVLDFGQVDELDHVGCMVIYRTGQLNENQEVYQENQVLKALILQRQQEKEGLRKILLTQNQKLAELKGEVYVEPQDEKQSKEK